MTSELMKRWIVVLGVLGGLLLTVIGIRYLLIPEQAARLFGVPGRPAGYELHYIIGIRNIWLGVLAVAFAALRLWSALTLWFATGTIVCFADAVIAASSGGRPTSVAFHVACGLACAVLAVVAWKVGNRKEDA